MLDPRLQGISGGCSDLELNRPLSFVLHHSRACRDLVSMADISDFECDQVTAAQLAVDAQIEERKLSYAPFHLEPDAKCPDILGLERCFLPDDLALVPRLAMSGSSYLLLP